MCFDLDSQPPIPPIAGAAVDGQRVSLTAADGTRFAAFDAQPESPTGAGVLIFPDVRGLHHFFEELALRFAERGINAVAVDYFARTAPNDDRGEGFDYQPHVAQTQYEHLMADAKAARDRLVDHGVGQVFTMGFCMGGRLAFVAGTRPELDVTGAIGFYGWPVGPGRGGTPAPADVAGEMTSSVLAIFGGADQGIPPEVVQQFADALDTAGVDNEVVTYPDAPHSFFDRKADEFAGESADAWEKVLEFIQSRGR
ncbi:MAG TPA: dienelactone hydrolase family protein [Candidatus Limnocylindrales bacterium]|nr:dienelactone hydrolase family protein [Candidatus Limnocylindrales bacterium]